MTNLKTTTYKLLSYLFCGSTKT